MAKVKIVTTTPCGAAQVYFDPFRWEARMKGIKLFLLLSIAFLWTTEAKPAADSCDKCAGVAGYTDYGPYSDGISAAWACQNNTGSFCQYLSDNDPDCSGCAYACGASCTSGTFENDDSSWGYFASGFYCESTACVN